MIAAPFFPSAKLLQIPTHDQRIGPRRGKVDNNRGPRGSPNGWLHAGGSHDVQSRTTRAAHLQDEYPTATVPAAHQSALDGGVHTRLLGLSLTTGPVVWVEFFKAFGDLIEFPQHGLSGVWYRPLGTVFHRGGTKVLEDRC